VLDAISRLSEDLSQSVLKLNEDQKRSPDGK
jgi:hypothetical protein